MEDCSFFIHCTAGCCCRAWCYSIDDLLFQTDFLKLAKHLYRFCKNEQTSVKKKDWGKKGLKTLTGERPTGSYYMQWPSCNLLDVNLYTARRWERIPEEWVLCLYPPLCSSARASSCQTQRQKLTPWTFELIHRAVYVIPMLHFIVFTEMIVLDFHMKFKEAGSCVSLSCACLSPIWFCKLPAKIFLFCTSLYSVKLVFFFLLHSRHSGLIPSLQL